MTAPAKRERPGGDGSAPKRSIGLWVGAGLGVLVTVAVLVATLASGGTGEDDAETPPSTAVPVVSSTTSPLQGVIGQKIDLPPGDYTEFCRVVSEAASTGADPSGGPMTPQRFTDVLSSVDFDALVAATPEGFRGQVELLRDSRDSLVALMDQVESLDDLAIEDFPEGVPAAIVAMGQAYTQECT